ncbi:MAG: pyridoxamine 5'-phosphate oxidase family protein [Oscillospiraceae bacterium]|nr:pyridoxamine 5'-phosphate oxidase family protein [Oscillospiraceae bacterium]
MINYEKAASYWVEKNKHGKVMEKDECLKRIESLVEGHNTLALATMGVNIRVTPVEYFYHSGNFYIFTEGGEKFRNLEKCKDISFCIYDKYTGGKTESLQADAVCNVVDFYCDEYNSVFQAKGLNVDKLKAKGIEMYLLRLDVKRYEYLNTSLVKDGYNAHQIVEV